MVTNQLGLKDNGSAADMRDKQRGLPLEGYSEMGEPGAGFGLGFSVIMRTDLVPCKSGAALTQGQAGEEQMIASAEHSQHFFQTCKARGPSRGEGRRALSSG